MNLSDVFMAVTYKELSQNDLPDGQDHHEVRQEDGLQAFFGPTEIIGGTIEWQYFGDDRDDLRRHDHFSFRATSAHTDGTGSESHCVFSYGDQFPKHAEAGDIIVLARIRMQTSPHNIHGLVFEQDSNMLHAAKILFGFDNPTAHYSNISINDLRGEELDFVRRRILERFEIAYP